MPNESRYRMVRLPVDLANRLDQIAADLHAAQMAGRTERVRVTEQGARGSWVSLPETIRVMADDYEDHRNRSRKAKTTQRLNRK